jgi:hypothetical protein
MVRMNMSGVKCYYGLNGIAERALPTLKQGAVSHMCSILPAIRTKSNFSAAQNAKQITDAIAFWASQKYVSSPFDIPPLIELRVNPLMAVLPPNNTWPILNLSAPKGKPPNGDLNPTKIPKIFIPTTKEFSWAALNCGFNTKWRNLTVIMCTKLFLASLPLGLFMAFPGIKNIL